MKRFIILAAAALLTFGGQVFAQQQDSYRQKVETLMAQGGDLKDMEKQIRDALQQSIPMDSITNDTLRSLVDYLQNGLMADLLNSYETSVRKYMTEEELDQMIEWMQRPESQAIKEKEKALAARMQSQDPEVLMYVGALVNGMMAVLQGQEPDKMYPSAQTEAWKKAFHNYYEASSVSATLRQTYDGILANLGQYMQGQPGAEDALRAATNYMVENLEPMMMLLYENVYTEEDLKYYTTFCKTSAYQHNAQAGIDFAGNISQFLMTIMGKMGIQ